MEVLSRDSKSHLPKMAREDLEKAGPQLLLVILCRDCVNLGSMKFSRTCTVIC